MAKYLVEREESFSFDEFGDPVKNVRHTYSDGTTRRIRQFPDGDIITYRKGAFQRRWTRTHYFTCWILRKSV